MGYLFDTDAISEVLKKRPASAYLQWLSGVPREDQFASAVVIGELYKGAFRSTDTQRHLRNIDGRILKAVTVLPYDVAIARVFGALHADLAQAGKGLADADLQIAATAIHHGLVLVTGNLRHFERIPRLLIEPVLAQSRRS